MTAGNDDRIRERAHRLWEQEGRPEGADKEHWERARSEIEAEGGNDNSAVDRPTFSPSNNPPYDVTQDPRTGRPLNPLQAEEMKQDRLNKKARTPTPDVNTPKADDMPVETPGGSSTGKPAVMAGPPPEPKQ